MSSTLIDTTKTTQDFNDMKYMLDCGNGTRINLIFLTRDIY